VKGCTFAGAALAAACALLAVGCSGGVERSGDASPTTAAGPTPAKRIRVGLVTTVGGLDDRSFNQGNYEGLLRAEEELGVAGRVLQSRKAADYVPNLSTLARQDYDLVVAVGFPMAKATDVVATRFPDTKFAIVDVPQESLTHQPPNVRGILFREQEGGYLAGYLAGLVVKEQGGTQVVSTVGGIKIPPVDRYIAGFQAGAKAANPGVTTLNGYSNNFVDPARCKEIALGQIDRGSQVVMQVAGGCGLGALDAARERNRWGIGADADQSFLGPHILSSALKLNPVSIFQTIETVKDGSFRGGEDTVFDVASGAVGLGRISPRVPNEIVAQVNQVQEDLAAGRIKGIPTSLG
jgi:basic membrane protein A and related proteins